MTHYFEVEVCYPELNKSRTIRGSNKNIVEQKARSQVKTWEDLYAKKQNMSENYYGHGHTKDNFEKENKKAIASQTTKELQIELDGLNKILDYTLDIDDAIDWSALIDQSDYSEPKPTSPILCEQPTKPPNPNYNFGFFTSLMCSLSNEYKNKKIEEMNEMFKIEYQAWTNKKNEIEKRNAEIIRNYELEVKEWKKDSEIYLKHKKQQNEHTEKQKKLYQAKEPDAVLYYCNLVLSNSIYPDYFPKQFDLDYNSESKIIIVDYILPRREFIPKVKELKYIASSDEFREKSLSEKEINLLYDNIVYQIALRTTHEIYEADVVRAIDSVVFNGIVDSIDVGTGNDTETCIVSLQTNKSEFDLINLKNIEPHKCFKRLNGIGSSRLYDVVAVPPVLTINRKDKRFVEAYSVVDGVEDKTNLAAMDWKDFENLIREIFQKEFNQVGGEVKITQASRDGGVDAVVFDPDPIRGGKIIIQAKRYTNVVGVSAVRDLYGTVQSEGAQKGILVTTSNFGHDSYSFAKNKPITLLNGSNLLSLLAKHGHKATINLKEAKSLLKRNN